MDRRTFLMSAMGTVFALSTPMRSLSSVLAEQPNTFSSVSEKGAGFSKQEWQTLEAVQDHLLPSGPEEPGAKDVNATVYLHAALSEPERDPSSRTFLRKGIVQLERISMDLKGKHFLDISSEHREAVLRRMETTPDGRHWIALILQFIFEALLGDPVYGGNPDGIGWKWLDHQPGFPRPPADKRYHLL